VTSLLKCHCAQSGYGEEGVEEGEGVTSDVIAEMPSYLLRLV